MEKKVIMLACAAGMSTSLLVSKMQKAATEKGFDAEIFAVAAAEAQDYVEKQHVDVVRILRKKWSQKEFQSVLFQWLITE